MENKEKIKKILIVRYRFIGDTVLTTPFIKNVSENFPQAEIDVLVSPNSGELIEGNPNVSNVIYLSSSKFHKYENTNILQEQKREIYYSFLGCIFGVVKKKYDLVFVLKRSFSSAILSFFTGAKYRVGFDTESRGFLLTHPIKYDFNARELDNFLNCLKPLNIVPKKYNTEIYPSESERNKAKENISKLDKFRPKIGIHMTSAHPYKEWKKSHLAKLLDLLYEKHNAQFVFTGAHLDSKYYDSVLSLAEHGGKFKYLNMCGKTTIRECYALYENLDFMICVDSGNSHLSAAANIPTYVLYGPTRPEKWLPVGKQVKALTLTQVLPCQPCDLKVRCNHINCMKLLSPEFVLSTLN